MPLAHQIQVFAFSSVGTCASGETPELEEVLTYRRPSPTLVEARLTIPPKGSVEIVDLRVVER